MARLTFSGGIHTYDGKDLSKNRKIVDALPDKELVFPLSQHIGAPAKSIVDIGERVLRGQKIAEAGGFVSACVYSSVSGTVKAIEKRRVATGDLVDSIIIENDDIYEEVEYSPLSGDASEISGDEIRNAIKNAGIVGMGGAGFPTHVKLSPKNPNDIDYVIANCAECEPYLTSDYRRILEEPEKLIGGLKLILSLFPNAHGILAVEDNKPDCVKLLRKMTKGDSRLCVKSLKTKYPQGSERHLIFATTGRQLNSSKLPADVGCVVNNVDTIVSIYRAVYEGVPVMERIVTLSGDCFETPGNYRVHTGMNYKDLVDFAGGFVKEPKKIICGGPMMGFSLFDLNIPITKTSTALLAFSKDDYETAKEGPCINCGKCVRACPSRLLPNKLSEFSEDYDFESFVKYGGMECVECGCCSYVCPAKRNLTFEIKAMRKMELANRMKK